MGGYTRTDTTNNINNGNIIDALYLDQEYDAIEAAFNASSGHKHDGSASEGAPIVVIGPAQDFVAGASNFSPKTHNIYDLGTNGVRFKDAYFQGTVTATTLVGAYPSTSLTGTIPSARLSGSYTSVTGVGALDAGSITSNFGSINIGTSTINCGQITATGITTTGGVFSGQLFASTTTNTVISNDGTGAIFLRPQGSGNTTGQVRINNDGSVIINGDLTVDTLLSNGSGITNLNASYLTSGTVPSARMAGAYSGISALGTLTALTVDNISLDGTAIKNTANNSVIRLWGGNEDGTRIELTGPSHSTLPWTMTYNANTHIFRNGAGDAIRATLTNVLSLGSNVAISFSGTGAATTRTNLGLGSLATQDEGTSNGQFRNNAANDARFHISGVNTLAATDLPSNVAGRDWVLGRIAAGQNNTSGMYALLRYDGSTTVGANDTVTGQLFFASVNGTGTAAATGTWKLLGRIGVGGGAEDRTSLWLKMA